MTDDDGGLRFQVVGAIPYSDGDVDNRQQMLQYARSYSDPMGGIIRSELIRVIPFNINPRVEIEFLDDIIAFDAIVEFENPTVDLRQMPGYLITVLEFVFKRTLAANLAQDPPRIVGPVHVDVLPLSPFRNRPNRGNSWLKWLFAIVLVDILLLILNILINLYQMYAQL